MNVRGAIKEVAELAAKRGAISNDFYNHESLGIDHILEMYDTVDRTPDMSETKMCRWLGWMQASVVACGLSTLEEQKELSRKYADTNDVT